MRKTLLILSILTVILLLVILLKNRKLKADEHLLLFCRASETSIKMDFCDSYYSISKINQKKKSDTLFIDVFTESGIINKSCFFEIDSSIKYISTGRNTYRVNNIIRCINEDSISSKLAKRRKTIDKK